MSAQIKKIAVFLRKTMCTEKILPNKKLLGSAEESRTPTWPQQVFNEPDDVLRVSDVQVLVPRVLGLPRSLNNVQRIREDELSCFAENLCACTKVACT